MIKRFVDAWDKNKKKLEEYFRNTKQEEYQEYKIILAKLIELVINPYLKENENENRYLDNELDIGHITEIDNGHYQGTLIYIIPEETYQPGPEEYITTYVYYGSCSGCDTLQRNFTL